MSALSLSSVVEVMSSDDHRETQQLIDMCMRPGSDLSMVEDFPLLLAAGGHARRVIVRTPEGSIIAHAAGLSREVYGPGAQSWRYLNIGAVCTHPEHRSRGLASMLVEALVEEARSDGHAAAILWTGQPNFYQRLGFSAAGREARFHLEPIHVETAPEFRVRRLRPDDLDDVLALRSRDICWVQRTRSEAERLFVLPGSSTWIVRENRRTLAYLSVGKGLDFQGTSCEWGGPAELLPSLAAAYFCETGEIALDLIGPSFDRSYIQTMNALGATRHDAPGFWINVLDVRRLEAVAFDRRPLTVTGQVTATSLFGSPFESVDARPPIPFFVWGLDSN